MEKDQDKILDEVTSGEYKYGFYSDIEAEQIQKGLNEDVVKIISEKKNEPSWLLEFRLKAYRHWKTMKMPAWPNLKIPEIDYQDIIYYSAPRQKAKLNSLDEIDPELKKTWSLKRSVLLRDKIDVTDFMVKLIESIPKKKSGVSLPSVSDESYA